MQLASHYGQYFYIFTAFLYCSAKGQCLSAVKQKQIRSKHTVLLFQLVYSFILVMLPTLFPYCLRFYRELCDVKIQCSPTSMDFKKTIAMNSNFVSTTDSCIIVYQVTIKLYFFFCNHARCLIGKIENVRNILKLCRYIY